MKMNIMKVVFSWGILGLLLLVPITSSALSTFNTETGYLAIPEVDVNGNTFYDNVGIRLNFTTGTFELVTGDARPETDTNPNPNPGGISTTPKEIGTLDDRLKLEFMGCEQSKNSSVTCDVLFTSLGGVDREVWIVAEDFSKASTLYDSNGVAHASTGLANFTTIGAPVGGWATVLLIAGVPTLAQYQFYNVDPEIGLSRFMPLIRMYGTTYVWSFRKF